MSESYEDRKKRRGCGFGCALVIGAFVGLGLLVAALLMGSLGAMGLSGEREKLAGLFHLRHVSEGMGEDEAPYMVETWSSGNGEVKVVRIPVSGTIMLGQSPWYAGDATTALRAIRRATHDPEVEGLILEVNSGGGGITDSDIIYKSILDFKAAQTGRVVVAAMGDVAASGAYYISLAADYILAHPTTLTGSIGVIMQTYNVKELASKLGVHDVTIKSGANKDLLNPFQDVNPEQTEILQKVIAAMHERFVGLVAVNRKLPVEEVVPLADGRVFLAEEALRLKLIDGIGYREDAQAKIAEMLDTDDVKVYRYDEQVTLMDLFARPGIGLSLDLNRLVREGVQDARLMFRWAW